MANLEKPQKPVKLKFILSIYLQYRSQSGMEILFTKGKINREKWFSIGGQLAKDKFREHLLK